MNPTFRITTRGSDTSPTGPWATLAGGRDALRKLRADGRLSGHATVVIAPGHYPLVDTVAFGPADSHTSYVAAPGKASPVFDGGRVLTGWKEGAHAGRRAWTLDLPEVAAGRLHFRSLFCNGERRPRARFPKFAPNARDSVNTLRLGAMRFPENRALFAGDHVFKPRPGDIEAWPSLHDAEIVLLHYWVETRLPNPRLDPATGWVSCARRSVFNLYESFNPKLARYYIDNLFEALTDPGEWYLDRSTGRLTYLPLDGETLANTRLVAPQVTRFIAVTGEAYNRGSGEVSEPHSASPVENLVFSGLTFRHSDWYQPAASMLPHDREAALGVTDVPLGSAPQSAAHVPATITFRWSRGCRFQNGLIENTGFTAIEFGPGCRHCAATGNTLRHLGGGGLKIGGEELDGPTADRTGFISVTDNRILHAGRVFHQSCGILLTHAFNSDLLHNEIAHTCYTGLSAGWSWGYRDTITRNLRIEHNHIHHIGEGVLSDNGGIYLLGVQPGTIVRGNHIHDVTAADYGGHGIYPDEGSAHLLIEHNWIHDVQGIAFSIHFGRELIFRHNVLGRSDEALAGVGRVENHVAANLAHNLFLGPAPVLFLGAYRGDIRHAFQSDANIFGFARENVPPSGHASYRKDVPERIPLEAWRRAGHDRLSIVAPIKFTARATSFSLPKGSPALAAGFKAFDWSVCGPRGGGALQASATKVG